MWLISLRDLQWRRRRFGIAVAATGLALAVTLVMGGLLHHMELESTRMVQLFDADAWVVARGANGPFTTTKLLPADAVDEVAQSGTVRAASPLLVLRSTVDRLDVNIVGYELGGITEPARVETGRRATARGQAMVDRSLKLDVGERVRFAGRSFPVVGVLRHTSFYFGQPTAFLPIEDVQDALAAGQPLASTIITRGIPRDLPAGLASLTDAQVRDDLDRTLGQSKQTLDLINVLLWIVASGIIGSIMYMSALERVREFAVLKATGASSRQLVAGLALQAVVLALLSCILAVLLSLVLASQFPFEAEISAAGYASIVVVALAVGVVASLAGVRRVTRVDPALAFGGS